MMCNTIIDIYSRTIVPDQPDSNGRVWPKDQLLKAINEFNARAPVVCEMNDPHNATVDLANASHTVVGLVIRQNRLTASIQVLGTPCGDVLQHIIDSGSDLFAKFSASGRIVNGEVHDIIIINVGITVDGTSTVKGEDVTLDDITF